MNNSNHEIFFIYRYMFKLYSFLKHIEYIFIFIFSFTRIDFFLFSNIYFKYSLLLSQYIYNCFIFVYFIFIFVDPAFWLMRFPLDGELDLYLKIWFLLIKKNDLESPLIFVLFLKSKQNKKEKPSVWLLTLEKVVCEKLDRVRGSGYLSGRYGKDRSTPLSS